MMFRKPWQQRVRRWALDIGYGVQRSEGRVLINDRPGRNVLIVSEGVAGSLRVASQFQLPPDAPTREITIELARLGLDWAQGDSGQWQIASWMPFTWRTGPLDLLALLDRVRKATTLVGALSGPRTPIPDVYRE